MLLGVARIGVHGARGGGCPWDATVGPEEAVVDPVLAGLGAVVGLAQGSVLCLPLPLLWGVAGCGVRGAAAASSASAACLSRPALSRAAVV